MFSCGYKLIDLLLQFLHCYVIIDFSGSANFKLILVQHINLISQSQRNGPTIRNKQSNHFHIRCSDIRKLISDLFIFFSLILMLGFAAHKKLFYEKLGFFLKEWHQYIDLVHFKLSFTLHEHGKIIIIIIDRCWLGT